MKNSPEITLQLSSNLIGDSIDETNFLHKLILIYKEVSKFQMFFTNKSSTNIKLSQPQLSKIVQSGGFYSRLHRPLVENGLPLMNKVLKPLAKSVLITSRLTTEASAAPAGIRKTILRSGCQGTLASCP